MLAPAAAAGLGDSPIVNPDVVVDPGPSISPPTRDDTTDTTTTDTETVPTETDATETDGTVTDGTGTGGETTRIDGGLSPRSPGWGNAALRPDSVKRKEADDTCERDDRPPVSKMLAVGGSVGNDQGGSYGLIALAVAAGAAVIAFLAFRITRRNPEREAALRPLEITATVVAIVSGLAGLAVQFIPGVGVREPPATEADLAVREVLARITRGEYARKTGADVRLVPRIDQREIGLVVWLEVSLSGYRDREPRLQYALYDPDRGGALLVGTGTTVELRVEDSDSQTLIVPIWVGYPRSPHFQARFRLVDGKAVREIAATSRLSTSNVRYACETDV